MFVCFCLQSMKVVIFKSSRDTEIPFYPQPVDIHVGPTASTLSLSLLSC